eukprot:COSAG01_NODE_34036_length_554_cov_2.591209_1_plen_109_part_01
MGALPHHKSSQSLTTKCSLASRLSSCSLLILRLPRRCRDTGRGALLQQAATPPRAAQWETYGNNNNNTAFVTRTPINLSCCQSHTCAMTASNEPGFKVCRALALSCCPG